MADDELDGVWKALSDSTSDRFSTCCGMAPHHDGARRGFPHLSRFGVMKHIEVLREAGLIHTREERRQRINSLNVVPIRQIYERWVGQFEELWASHLLRIKEDAEARTAEAGTLEHKKRPQKGLTDNTARTQRRSVPVRNTHIRVRKGKSDDSNTIAT